MVLIVVTQSYVAKRTPKMIRGMIMGVIGMFTSVGIIVYLQLVARTIGPTTNANMGYIWVFGYVAALDGVVLAFALVMIALNLFGNSAPHEDAANEGPGRSDKVAGDSDGSFGSENADWPMGDIEELDEDDEVTERDESLRFNS
jgi:MFS family permease